MSDVTRILSHIESGDPVAAEQLLPLVYDELRKLAAAKLAKEKPGQTLQATALVHEAYIRLVGNDARKQAWEGRGHFFAAAAEAMRRILVDQARRKLSVRHGGQTIKSSELDDILVYLGDPAETLAVNELLERLASQYPRLAEIAKLRLFLNCTLVEIGEILGISSDTAQEDWAYARAWLKREWRHETRD